MRILFLHRHASANGIGGVMEYLHYLPQALKRHGVETYLYREDDPSSKTIAGPSFFQNEMPVFSGPFLKPSHFFPGRKLKPLIELCRREGISLIHAQGTYRSGYLAMKLHQHTSIPYIVTSHSDIIPNSKRMQRAKIVNCCQKILKNAAAVTHLSPSMADFSHRLYPTMEKSALIANGIHLQEWLSFSTQPTQNYLLAIGRLEVEKGFHVLIDAYAQLRAQGVKTSLVLAGTGSAEAALHAQVKQRGLRLITQFTDFSAIPEEAVVFTGYVRGEAKMQLMAQSKIILFSTQPALWEEPFGIVQIEAMAAGKPLIASDSAITRHLQTLGLQALLAQPDSSSSWAGQMEALLKNSSLQDAMGQANRAHASQFDWDVIAKHYQAVYQHISKSVVAQCAK